MFLLQHQSDCKCCVGENCTRLVGDLGEVFSIGDEGLWYEFLFVRL